MQGSVTVITLLLLMAIHRLACRVVDHGSGGVGGFHSWLWLVSLFVMNKGFYFSGALEG